MSDKTRRFILWNSFLYLIALCLALKIVDVSVYGPSHAYAQIGLSRLNLGFRKLLHYSDTYLYSKPWLTVAAVINIICILLCIFWVIMFIREMVKSGRFDGVGMDKNYCATVFLYAAAGLSCLLLKLFKINYGPVAGHLRISASFPSVPVLLYIVSIGSTLFHVWDIFGEKKNLSKALTVIGSVLVLLGTVAVSVCGICWLTDVLGSVLLGIVLMMLYTFFFDI